MSASHKPVRPIRKVKRASYLPAKRDRKGLWAVVILVSVCLLACWFAYSHFRSVFDKWEEWEKENMSRPVTYAVPAATQFIYQYASPKDFFGDFFYCAAFQLPQGEYESLLRHGFNWIYMGQGSTTPTPEVPKWQTGHLPESILSSTCFDRLTAGTDEATTYRYLLEKGENWIFLLAIDEQSKTIFYQRSSW